MSSAQSNPRPEGSLDRILADLAADCHGVISYEDALKRGASKHHLHNRVRSGLLSRVHPRVFVLRGSPDSWMRRAAAALKWAGRDAALSHRTAAHSWGLIDRAHDAPIELSTTRDLRPSNPDVIVHVTRWHPGDLCRRDRLAMTTPTRTLIDLAGVVGEDNLQEAFENGWVRELINLPRLSRRLELVRRRGRKGVGVLADLIDEADGGTRLTRSVLERRYLRESAAAGLPIPELQFPVSVAERNYRIDFAYPQHKLAIELDGWRFHGGRSDWVADIARSNALVAEGWRVLRGTWKDVEEHPNDLLQRVRQALTPELPGLSRS